MNITELARRLKVTPQELRETLPRIGFDIGKKAIKVDDKMAQRILKEWPQKIKELQEQEEKEKQERENDPDQPVQKKQVEMPNYITVNEFANLSGLPVSNILKELMKNGVFASINEKIDYDTATIIGEDLNLDIKLKDDTAAPEESEAKQLEEALEKETEENMQERPPIIVVMGHVDHGKTKLLDTIRESNVAGKESGGITQHIGAYQAEKRDRLITFIDTPGHEAFTAMRSRGAKVADIAILIVAADDGVKPQTIEAFKIIQAAEVPYIVAINKIDKEGADVNKTKQELSTKLGIVPEDWGGKIICSPISAKQGEGVQELLDTILLLSDTAAKETKANPNSPGIGTIIESHVDKSTGPVATILIQNGTLSVGDQLLFRDQVVGKVRAMEDYKSLKVQKADPSMPVKITGLKVAPTVGDILHVDNTVKGKAAKIKKSGSRVKSISQTSEDEAAMKFNIILKSDFLGSAEAIEESLMKINTEEVKANIIYKGLGNIREGDVLKAEASEAEIIGFNVKMSPQIENLVREKGIKVKNFSIIYDLIEYVKGEMQKLIQATIEREDVGRLKVLAVFRTEKDNQIIGGKVIDGKLEPNTKAEVIRDDKTITQGLIEELKIGKEDINEAEKDQECGIKFKGSPEIQEGDIINVYKEKEVYSKLD